MKSTIQSTPLFFNYSVIFLSALSVLFSACGTSSQVGNTAAGKTNVNATEDQIVVKSQAIIQIQTGSTLSNLNQTNRQESSLQGPDSQEKVSNPIPVSVINSASTSMTVSTTGFIVPKITNAVLNFGNLQVLQLFDNNLDLCGTAGNQKCTTALIRMYTTGTPLAGLYNSTDNVGMPILAGLTQPLSTVGLAVANANILQTYKIPSTQHVMALSDFPSPTYLVNSDFTQAGAGTYSTTLVLEYALAP